jgi:hypothetical protein
MDLLRFCMASVKLWATTTQIAREKFKRDFDITEGNGKQWYPSDRAKNTKNRRPSLEFNQVLPQVELVSGIQRSLDVSYVALPRGVEDKRLGEIVSSSLKATAEYTRLARKNAHVFDDGTICGLGVWKILHSIHDAEDILWGDITVDRLNPLSFIWDPWATADEAFQDGAFMGDASWVKIEEFKRKHPDMTNLANPGEWLNHAGQFVGDSELFGVGPNLRQELYDQETGMIRLITLWHKVPTKIHLMINLDSGQVTEVESESKGQERLAQIAEQFGSESAKQFGVIQAGATTALVDQQSGQAEEYATPEAAQQRLGQLSAAKGMEVYEKMKVITREARVPHWVELVWGQIVEYGKTPHRDRKYPYVPYVSRMFQDDPESIMGIVRNLWDPQDEFNKRYSNLLSHSNSSAHSGWINKKTGGANSSELERMGTAPGIVVEYGSIAPSQIHPVEMSQGHFTMLQTSGAQIMHISGVNAEMVGAGTQKTVSGRAIKARQDGGQTILKPRLFNFDEAQLDVTHLLLSRIQQYYPPAKLKRIIGLSEMAGVPPGGISVFQDPLTGQPLPEQVIYEMLVNMSNIQFDLAIKQAPADATERQAEFERAVSLIQLIASSGRPPGPATLSAMVELSDMPTRVAQGMQLDAMAPPVMPPSQDGGQGVMNKMKQARGGHDSGGPGPTQLNQGG